MNGRFTQPIVLMIGLAQGAAALYFLAPVATSAQMNASAPASAADRALMQSMTSMHDSMMGAKLTGNSDHDFLIMMIPHHQAAVQMARAELRYGKDPKVRALAGQIISAQQKEIHEMTSWL